MLSLGALLQVLVIVAIVGGAIFLTAGVTALDIYIGFVLVMLGVWFLYCAGKTQPGWKERETGPPVKRVVLYVVGACAIARSLAIALTPLMDSPLMVSIITFLTALLIAFFGEQISEWLYHFSWGQPGETE